MTQADEYVFGVNASEIERLEHQHSVWAEQQRKVLEIAGIGAGDRVLDAGSGPGATSFELARLVGPTGSVIARDQGESFLAYLEAKAAELDLPWVTTSLGPIEDLDLPRASLDGAYARWLLSWVPDAGRALAPIVAALRPGGSLVLQEYLAWGAMKLIPRSAAFDRGKDACLQSWADEACTIDIAEDLPGIAAELGLVLEHFEPATRMGAPGSPEWTWAMGFLRGYVPKQFEAGRIDRADLDAFLAVCAERESQSPSYLVTPTVASLVLRKP